MPIATVHDPITKHHHGNVKAERNHTNSNRCKLEIQKKENE